MAIQKANQCDIDLHCNSMLLLILQGVSYTYSLILIYEIFGQIQELGLQIPNRFLNRFNGVALIALV